MLAAACLGLPALASVDATRVPDAEARARAFDAAFAEVTGPASLDATTEAHDAGLERLRALLPAGDAAREARLRAVYCASSHWKDATQGLAYSEAALRLARDARDPASEARALLCRAAYTMLTSGSRRGLPDVERAIALLEKAREPQLLAEALETRGDILSLLGEQASAMMDFQRARAAYRDAGIAHEVEPLMQSIAVAYRRMGDLEQAQRHFTGALARMRERGNWEAVANNLIQLGFVHVESGAPDKALAAFQEAAQVAARHRIPYSLNAARLGVAEAQIALGHPQAALDSLAQARAGFKAEHDASSDDMVLLLSGQAMARKGNHAGALAHYQAALPLIRRNGNDRYLAMLYKAQAASREALGQAAEALADHKRYTELQLALHGKARLQQSRMLEYEYWIRQREFENRRLREDAELRGQRLASLERVRRWQWAALGLGGVLVALLATLAWRQWRRSRGLRALAMTDPVTGAASRVGIEDQATRALAMAAHAGRPVSVLLLDLDRFKPVNDRHGHAAGDRVLAAAVAAWRQQLRAGEPLGRIGGDEFLVLCPGTPLEAALQLAERLREATTAIRLPGVDPALRMTVSIGAAQAHPADSRESLLERVDAALYRAKQRGRDRVEA